MHGRRPAELIELHVYLFKREKRHACVTLNLNSSPFGTVVRTTKIELTECIIAIKNNT